METVIEETGIREWRVRMEDDPISVIVWRLKDDSLYCTDCSSKTCEHVHAVWRYLR